jgi:hypothetical protein
MKKKLLISTQQKTNFLSFMNESISAEIQNEQKNNLTKYSEFQKIEEISFKQAQIGDDEYNSAITTRPNTNQSPEEQAYNILSQENWTLQEYWQKKDTPKEQLIIKSLNGLELNLYNFGEELSAEQETEIIDAINKMASIIPQSEQSNIQYILIDNKQSRNPNDDSIKNGSCGNNCIILHPQAMKDISHRINGVSNLTGTIIHEFSHGYLQNLILTEWQKDFGWKELETNLKLPNGTFTSNEISNPENCITEYATYSPKEDFVESMVAAIETPNVLDPERLNFIKEKFLKNQQSSTITTEKLTGNSIQLPRITNDVFYKIKKIGRFEINTPKRVHEVLNNSVL